jgi:hypothetical protein
VSVDCEIVEEVVDGVPVPDDTSVSPIRRRIAGLPASQVATAAVSTVATALAITFLSRQRKNLLLRRRRPKTLIGEILSTNSVLVDLHLIKRRRR